MGPRRRLAAILEGRVTRDEPATRAKALVTELAHSTVDTALVYKSIRPEGEPLDEIDSERVRDRLAIGAQCLRRVEQQDDVVEWIKARGASVGADTDIMKAVSVLRVMQRSLVLALSDDPTRRAQAISVRDLQALYRPVQEFWKEFPGR